MEMAGGGFQTFGKRKDELLRLYAAASAGRLSSRPDEILPAHQLRHALDHGLAFAAQDLLRRFFDPSERELPVPFGEHVDEREVVRERGDRRVSFQIRALLHGDVVPHELADRLRRECQIRGILGFGVRLEKGHAALRVPLAQPGKLSFQERQPLSVADLFLHGGQDLAQLPGQAHHLVAGHAELGFLQRQEPEQLAGALDLRLELLDQRQHGGFGGREFHGRKIRINGEESDF